MRSILANVCLLGYVVALLAHFGFIWKYGSYYIQEPSTAIFIAEVVLLVLIGGLAITNLVKDILKEV